MTLHAPITLIRTRIAARMQEACRQCGFCVDQDLTFRDWGQHVVRIIHVGFFTTAQAAYFKSTTASFTVALGVYFNFDGHEQPKPKEFEAHLRGNVLRGYHQTNPLDLRGFSLFHPERWRRDVWWVDKDGGNADKIADMAAAQIGNQAMTWLKTYSNIDYALNHIRKKKETQTWQKGPFGFGAPGSTARTQLIDNLKRLRDEI